MANHTYRSFPWQAVLLIATGVYCALAAAEPVGRVVKLQGDAEVRDSAGQRRAPAQVGTMLNAGESLHASGKSTAALRTTAGDTIVVDSDSAVRVKDDRNTFEQLIGKVLYFFRSSKRVDRRVELQTVAVGVRGTTFLVDTAGKDDASIALKEGTVDVDSKGDGFNLYRRKEQTDFEAFKREIREGVERERKEFERYRAKEQEEFIAFQKSMQLKPQESLTIAGDKATVGRIDEEMESSIRRLEDFSRELR
jgi:hypothetical protein